MRDKSTLGNVVQAKSAQFEFLKESHNCSTPARALCREAGRVEAVSAELITTNAALDYTLLKLDARLARTYGYFQAHDINNNYNIIDKDEMNARHHHYPSLTVGSPVYMPQHPRGGCKLISYLNDDTPSKPTVITAMDRISAYVKWLHDDSR
jgi:hypothetical protein